MGAVNCKMLGLVLGPAPGEDAVGCLLSELYLGTPTERLGVSPSMAPEQGIEH